MAIYTRIVNSRNVTKRNLQGKKGKPRRKRKMRVTGQRWSGSLQTHLAVLAIKAMLRPEYTKDSPLSKLPIDSCREERWAKWPLEQLQFLQWVKLEITSMASQNMFRWYVLCSLRAKDVTNITTLPPSALWAPRVLSSSSVFSFPSRGALWASSSKLCLWKAHTEMVHSLSAKRQDWAGFRHLTVKGLSKALSFKSSV